MSHFSLRKISRLHRAKGGKDGIHMRNLLGTSTLTRLEHRGEPIKGSMGARARAPTQISTLFWVSQSV